MLVLMFALMFVLMLVLMFVLILAIRACSYIDRSIYAWCLFPPLALFSTAAAAVLKKLHV